MVPKRFTLDTVVASPQRRPQKFQLPLYRPLHTFKMATWFGVVLQIVLLVWQGRAVAGLHAYGHAYGPRPADFTEEQYAAVARRFAVFTGTLASTAVRVRTRPLFVRCSPTAPCDE